MQDGKQLVLGILRVVVPELPDDREIGLGDRLEDLGVDSLGLMQIVAEVEDALGVEFPDSALVPQTFESVRSLVTVVASL
jgi:acyl carrier protein